MKEMSNGSENGKETVDAIVQDDIFCMACDVDR